MIPWTLFPPAFALPKASFPRWRYALEHGPISYIHAYLTLRAQIHGDKMRAALTMDMLATDLADYLVRKGVSVYIADSAVGSLMPQTQVPFRDTHHISGRAVALAESRKCQLNDLTVKD